MSARCARNSTSGPKPGSASCRFITTVTGWSSASRLADRPLAWLATHGQSVRIVITGALGHIGSRLIRALPDVFPDASIVMVDDLSSQRYCSLFNLPANGRYRFLEADILSADLNRIFEGAEAVVHLAAVTNAVDSFSHPEKVARACIPTGAALVFVSTTSVYGTASGLVDEDCPDADLRPQSPYADSKLRAEHLLDSLARSEGLRHVTCRFGTVFGPSPGMRFHTAINKFCWQAVNRLPLSVWSTALNQDRPYLELGDAVAALQFLLKRKLFNGGLFNVLTLNASVRQIIEEISAHVPETRVRHVDSPIMNQLSYRVANRRLANLGFECKGTLKLGIGETIRLLRTQASGMEADAIGQDHVAASGTV